MKQAFILAILFSFINMAQAETGLTVNVAEIGIGKFHRKDNSIHPYADNNIWKPYVLSTTASLKTPQTVSNKDGSYTIFFSNLDELFGAMEKLSQDKKMKIANFNVNAHGLPGHMWYPKDASTQASYGCRDWRKSAAAPDEDNYKQYYSPVEKEDILQIRAISQRSSLPLGISCVSGLKEWQEVAAQHHLKDIFTTDAQIHFMSCVVGLGKMGDEFTKGIAALLLSQEQSRVQTSLMFGLGDWSMPEGMGFWDYQSDEQLDRDNTNYPVNRSDREQMQKGTIRTAGILNGNIVSSLMEQRDFMFADARDPGTLSAHAAKEETHAFLPMPSSVRIPGTNVRVTIQK